MHHPSLPPPGPAAAPAAPRHPPGRLELRAVERSLAPCGWGARRAAPPVAPTTATVAAGERVALVGDPRAAVALLWCVAGLARPTAGELRWLDGDGSPGPAPPRAFVGLGWRGYDCWTVRDALESAVPAGAPQAEADRRVAAVLRHCSALPPGAPIRALGAPSRWLVGVCAAVAAGARWLLLEAPAAAGTDPAVHAGLRRLSAAGLTLLAASHDGSSTAWPGWRLLPLAVPQATARDPGAARRVAELADPGAPGACAGGTPRARSVELPPGAP